MTQITGRTKARSGWVSATKPSYSSTSTPGFAAGLQSLPHHHENQVSVEVCSCLSDPHTASLQRGTNHPGEPRCKHCRIIAAVDADPYHTDANRRRDTAVLEIGRAHV